MSTGRYIGGSLLPSSEPRILQPIETPFGTLQVRALPELDTHALFRTDSRGTSMVAEHANGFSCHELAKRMVVGDEARIRAQVQHILMCGGMARHVNHIVQITRDER